MNHYSNKNNYRERERKRGILCIQNKIKTTNKRKVKARRLFPKRIVAIQLATMLVGNGKLPCNQQSC